MSEKNGGIVIAFAIAFSCSQSRILTGMPRSPFIFSCNEAAVEYLHITAG